MQDHASAKLWAKKIEAAATTHEMVAATVERFDPGIAVEEDPVGWVIWLTIGNRGGVYVYTDAEARATHRLIENLF